MNAAASTASRNTYSIGLTTRLVTVNSVSADGTTAVCTDANNTEVRVPMLWQRAKGALPVPGEKWIISQDVTSSWSFALVMNAPESAFPDLPGAWQPLAFTGAGTFTGTSRFMAASAFTGITVQVSGSFSAAGSPSAQLPPGYSFAVPFPWPASGAAKAAITAGGLITISSVTASGAVGFCQDIPSD